MANAARSIEVPSRGAQWRSAAGFVAICEAVGFLSGVAAGQFKRNAWIDDTPKPALWPPQWVFPVWWTAVNYPSLGIATWLVRRRHDTASAADARRLFVAQLILNAAFLPVVNRAESRAVYVAIDAAGVALTAATTRTYFRISRAAGIAIIPYMAWTCFTTLIKVMWWRMEKSQRGIEPRRRAVAPM